MSYQLSGKATKHEETHPTRKLRCRISSQNSVTEIKVDTQMAMVMGRRLEQPRLKDGLGPQLKNMTGCRFHHMMFPMVLMWIVWIVVSNYRKMARIHEFLGGKLTLMVSIPTSSQPRGPRAQLDLRLCR